MNWNFIIGILTVVCAVSAIAIINDAVREMKNKNIRANIYRDIQPHQVRMMKAIFPKFDWVRIEREIELAQGHQVVYEANSIDEYGGINCSPKRIDTRV